MQGKVKWFDAAKGYGFIACETGNDVFVHWSQIDQEGYKTLQEGDVVSFTLIQEEKGMQANTVKVIKDADK